MSTPAGREWRHQLRTPINHVLGYTELLLEEARDGGHDAQLGELQQIHREAQAVLARVNQALASQDDLDGTALEILGNHLRTSVERIVSLADSLEAQAPEWSADLGKVRSGARSLLALLGGARDPVEAAAGVEETKAAGVRAGQGYLLVVDDNAANRQMLRRLLERQGYGIAEADNGRRALEKMGEERFDLVLLDIMMPVMDGFEVLDCMKRDAALREIPVLVVSAVDEMESVVRSIEMGAEDYLLKPFDPVLLRARIGASLEKHRLRNELVVQEKLASLGALTAGVAHEIRNPLNFVTNFAELSVDLARELSAALKEAGGRLEWLEMAEDLERNVAKIKEHGRRADKVVQSMLLHSRGQSGERRAADFNALVAEAVNLAYHGLRAQDPTFHAAIESEYDARVGMVELIPQDVSRVILNVAGNAFYALRQNRGERKVWIVTCDLGSRAEVRIRDNGPGIPPEILGRIFEPFFTTKPAGQGTGLGLSISYDIVVRAHQGDIRAESREGEGATFIVTLPKGTA